MRKMFTKLFGLTLLMFLFSALTVVRAQVPVQTACGPTITVSDIKLVTPIANVCDSSELITFKVVGYPGAELYINGSTTPSPDSTFSAKEGVTVYVQIVLNDTCVSNQLPFSTNVVEPIVIEEPDIESPKCGDDLGEVSINFSGGYTTDFGAPADPYRYQIVPLDTFLVYGPQYYANYVSLSPNIAKGPGTYMVTAYDNKPEGSICLADLTVLAAWDTAIVNPASPAVVIDTIYGDDPICFDGTTSVYVEVSGGSGDTLIVSLLDESDDSVVGKDTTVIGLATFLDVPEGSYYASVIDSVGCDDISDSTLVLTAPDKVAFDIAINSISCFDTNDGKITVILDTNFVGYDAANVYQALVVSLDTATDDSVYTWTSFVNDSVVFDALYPIYYSAFVRDSTNGCDSVPYVNPNNSLNNITLQSPGEVSYDITYEFGMDSIPCYGDSIWVTLDNLTGGSGEYAASLSIYGGALITDFSDTISWLLPVGSYIVTVKDTNVLDCGTPTTFTIGGNDQLYIDYVDASNPICPGGADGLIEIFAGGGTGTYEYSIDSVNWYVNNVFNGPAGDYTVYARDAVCHNNVAEDNVTINEDENVISVIDSDTMICEGGTDGYFKVGVESWNITSGSGIEHQRMVRAYYTTDMDSVGVSGTQMERMVNANGYHISFETADLMAGTYYVWAVDTFGCVANDLTVVVDEYDPLQLDVEVIDSASCAGINDGLIKLTMSGGDTTSWYLSGPFAVAEKSASIQEGSYYYWDCGYGSFKYGVAATYQQALLKDPASLNCWPVIGAPSYDASVEEKSASVGTGYYADEVYINITAGTFYVILYDEACDQRVIKEVNVFGYGAVSIADTALSVTDIVCYGEKAGEITINAGTGGSGDLVYTLYEGGKTMADTVKGYVEVTDTVFSNLPAGDYYVQVTDMGPDACAGDWTEMIPVTQPDLDFSIESYDITCNGNADGLLVLSMKGAGDNAPLFKLGASSWKKFDTLVGDTVWVKNIDILEPGDYVVSAIDSLGRVAGCDGMELPFTIIEPPVLTITAEGIDSTACSSTPDGYITVTIDGGKTSVDTFEVQLTGVDTAIIARDSVLVFEGLDEGGYELVVTEVATGLTAPCVMTDSVWVTPPPSISVEVVDFTDMVACKDDSTGIIKLDITGGSGAYAVSVNGDAVELDTLNQITGLGAGKYVVVVKDSALMAGADSLCTTVLDTVVITEPDEYLTLDATKIQDVSCKEDGMFSVQADGGYGDYKYYAALSKFPAHILLPDPTSAAWQDDSIFTVTEPGTWVVWVMDEAGCIVGGEFDKNGVEINKWRVPIGAPEVEVTVSAVASNPTCNGDYAMIVVNPDSITVTLNNVVVDRPYVVWFESLAGDVLAANDTLQMTITDTTYVLAMVKDTLSGCTGVDTIMLTQPDVLSADALVIADGEFTCPDATEGYMEAVASGGTKPYTFQIWQNGAIKTPAYSSNNSFLAKVDNSYSFVVMDAKGCTDTLEVAVPVESADSIKFDITDVTCSSDTLGSVEITLTGGEVGRTFIVYYDQIESDSPADSGSDTISASGTVKLDQVLMFDNENIDDIHYAIWVEDNMGCVSTVDTITIDQIITSPLELVVSEGNAGTCATEFTLSVSGGVAPYVITVDGEEVVAGKVMIAEGTHLIVASDAHSCTVSEEVSLAYTTSIDTTITIYVGDTANFVYETIDTMLVGGEYTFYYEIDTACTGEVNVTVEELEKIAPVLETMSPTDTIADNHPVFVLTFSTGVSLGDGGNLYVLAPDSTVALTIALTEGMFTDSTLTVDYDWTVNGSLDLNTTYFVQVDSAAVMGQGIVWEGLEDYSWTFTTGDSVKTAIDPEFSTVDFKVYPNPFNDFIRIDNYDKLSRVVVSNIAGQRVLDIENPTYEIRTGRLVTGVYVVTLISDGEIVKSERIIKR